MRANGLASLFRTRSAPFLSDVVSNSPTWRCAFVLFIGGEAIWRGCELVCIGLLMVSLICSGMATI